MTPPSLLSLALLERSLGMSLRVVLRHEVPRDRRLVRRRRLRLLPEPPDFFGMVARSFLGFGVDPTQMHPEVGAPRSMVAHGPDDTGPQVHNTDLRSSLADVLWQPRRTE